MQVRNYIRISSVLDDFGVEDVSMETWVAQQNLPNLHGIVGAVERIDAARRIVHLSGQPPLFFDKVCLCTGAVPLVPVSHPRVFGLRDAEVCA